MWQFLIAEQSAKVLEQLCLSSFTCCADVPWCMDCYWGGQTVPLRVGSAGHVCQLDVIPFEDDVLCVCIELLVRDTHCCSDINAPILSLFCPQHVHVSGSCLQAISST